MSIILNSGFSGYVSIESDATELFKQDIHSLKEANDFIDKYGKSVPGGSLLRATIIPLRTDCWKDFAKDLFLPTFINHALKVDNVVLKILASALAITLDVALLIPRLIASPFRISYNNKHKSEHPLTVLIKDKPQFAEAIKSGVVKIRVNFEAVNIQEDVIIQTTDTDLKIRTAKQFVVDGYIMVTIRQLPGIKEKSEFNERWANYMEVDGEWDVQVSDTGKSQYLRAAC